MRTLPTAFAVSILLTILMAACGTADPASSTIDAAVSATATSIAPTPTASLLVATDADADGSPESLDCDDNDPSVFPGATEVNDNRDNDCDGVVDGVVATDADADGSPANVDCDDNDSSVFPGATEVNDNRDNDCDGTVDGVVAVDADGDGSPANVDCDDNDPSVFPGATEVSDNRDNDCDGTVDGVVAVSPTPAATPVPTSTPLPQGIEVTSLTCIDIFFGVPNPSGETHELRISISAINRTGTSQLWSGTTISLLDGQGLVVDQHSFDPLYSMLPNGDAVEFTVSIQGSQFQTAATCQVHFDRVLGNQPVSGQGLAEIQTIFAP